MVELVAALLLFSDAVGEIARDARGRVGAAAEILEDHKIVLRLRSRERFPMQSVYKLPIAMAVMADVDRGKLRLDQTVRIEKSEYISPGQHSPLRDTHPDGADVTVKELLELAVGQSDGTASDVLLRLASGPPAVMKYLRENGAADVIVRDREMTLGHDPTAQYRNWATPEGAVAVLRALHETRGLSVASRELLIKILTDTQTSPGRIKGLLPPGTVTAHKTGSSGERNGVAAATNDIGIVTLPDGKHLAIAVFVSDSRADAAARDRAIAQIARAAWDAAKRAP